MRLLWFVLLLGATAFGQPAGQRGRTVVDELVKDAQNAAYTKRKFGEVSAGR